MEKVQCPNCEITINFKNGVPLGTMNCPNCKMPFCPSCSV